MKFITGCHTELGVPFRASVRGCSRGEFRMKLAVFVGFAHQYAK